jgi:hypothetical protein
MSDNNDHDANNNNLPSSTEAAVIPPGSAKKGDVGNTKPHGWTAELDIALLEELLHSYSWVKSNNKVLGECSRGFENCGIPFDNYQTAQCHWSSLKDKFIKEWAKQEAAASVENFGENDDDDIVPT